MKIPSSLGQRPRLIAAAILGAIALSCGAAAIAADNGPVFHLTVSFSDLDISTRSGAATLYSRIKTAAFRVCEPYDTDDDPLFLDYDSLHKACIHNAIARAVNKVGGYELSAIYAARNSRHGR